MTFFERPYACCYVQLRSAHPVRPFLLSSKKSMTNIFMYLFNASLRDRPVAVAPLSLLPT